MPSHAFAPSTRVHGPFEQTSPWRRRSVGCSPRSSRRKAGSTFSSAASATSRPPRRGDNVGGVGLDAQEQPDERVPVLPGGPSGDANSVPGAIVFVASMHSEVLRAVPNTVPYAIAKTGLVVLAKSLAKMEAGSGDSRERRVSGLRRVRPACPGSPSGPGPFGRSRGRDCKRRRVPRFGARFVRHRRRGQRPRRRSTLASPNLRVIAAIRSRP